MAISRLHAFLALSGLAAITIPTATVLTINYKNKTNNNPQKIETAQTTTSGGACSAPIMTSLYNKITGTSSSTSSSGAAGTTGSGSGSATTPDKTKQQWEKLMKAYGLTCQEPKTTT